MTTAAISIGLPPLSFTFSRWPFRVRARSEILLRFGWRAAAAAAWAAIAVGEPPCASADPAAAEEAPCPFV